MSRARSCVLIAALIVPALSCDTYVGTRGPTALTHTFLMDAPFPYYQVAKVELYVVSVSGSVVPDTSPGSPNFVTLAEPHRLIDVLKLQNGLADELGTAQVPTGSITAVRMIIDTDSSSMTLVDGRKLTSTSSPGINWQSSAGRPVLNALINEDIGIGLGGGVVVIDYDVGEAFLPNNSTDAEAGFVFSPVLRAADANRSGWITGSVRAQSSTGLPVPNALLRLYLGSPANDENTWTELGTATTNASGVFRFSMVPRSEYWGTTAHAGETYIVTADPPPTATLGRAVVPNITVSAAAGTETAVIVLP